MDVPHSTKFSEDGHLITNASLRENRTHDEKKVSIQHNTLNNKAKINVPIIDQLEENWAYFVFKCCNWLQPGLEPELTTTDHLKILLFFFLKAMIVVGSCALIFCCFSLKKSYWNKA